MRVIYHIATLLALVHLVYPQLLCVMEPFQELEAGRSVVSAA